MATIGIFDFLLNKFLKIVRPLFESGYKTCVACSRARMVYDKNDIASTGQHNLKF